MSFNNLYYKRTAGTGKACYVCYKPTTTVLATINTVDFLYTCPGHLTDSGFATFFKDEGNASSSVSAEEIARVKAEWEEKQKKKLEKEKEKEKEKVEEKEKEKSKDKESKSGDKDKKDSKSPLPGLLSTTPTPSTPAHERYILHRDFFAMRQSEHRKRRQAAQAKELAPRLPGAPRGELMP